MNINFKSLERVDFSMRGLFFMPGITSKYSLISILKAILHPYKRYI